jgi:hypothetical protein
MGEGVEVLRSFGIGLSVFALRVFARESGVWQP